MRTFSLGTLPFMPPPRTRSPRIPAPSAATAPAEGDAPLKLGGARPILPCGLAAITPDVVARGPTPLPATLKLCCCPSCCWLLSCLSSILLVVEPVRRTPPFIPELGLTGTPPAPFPILGIPSPTRAGGSLLLFSRFGGRRFAAASLMSAALLSSGFARCARSCRVEPFFLTLSLFSKLALLSVSVTRLSSNSSGSSNWCSANLSLIELCYHIQCNVFNGMKFYAISL